MCVEQEREREGGRERERHDGVYDKYIRIYIYMYIHNKHTHNMFIELPQTFRFVCQSRRDRFDIASGAAAASWLQDGLEPDVALPESR